MNGEGEDIKLHLEFEKYSFKNLRNTIYKIRNTPIFKADYEANYVIHVSRKIKWRERGVGVIRDNALFRMKSTGDNIL